MWKGQRLRYIRAKKATLCPDSRVENKSVLQNMRNGPKILSRCTAKTTTVVSCYRVRKQNLYSSNLGATISKLYQFKSAFWR